MLKSNLLVRTSGLIAAVVALWSVLHDARSSSSEPTQPLTVAFIGDQGLGYDARAVLGLIRSEGADMVLHQGDFDYENDPSSWDAMINDVLGADFPYFASVGNNDIDRFYGPDGYQAKLKSRLNKIRDARCIGDLGVQSACTFKGLFFILSGVGTMPDRPDDPSQVAFIRKQLAQDRSAWRICSWHKNQRMMQLGEKTDEVGWGPYEACREGGAIIATAHEHSYSRTHLLDSFQSLSIASTSSTLRVEKGKSFAFVSGLGGLSIRNQDQDSGWWAAVYTSDRGANFGALFCTFFVDGEPNRASCYFKDIDGEVPDRFGIVSEIAPN
jgi:hypothetical protein